ncbi:universal stress protein [Streptosporangium sp. NPDC003464]
MATHATHPRNGDLTEMPLPASRHVVVALDGSPGSIAALRRGAAEAGATGARLVVVHVLPDGPLGPGGTEGAGGPDGPGDRDRLRAGEVDALIAATVPDGAAAAARTIIAHGDPAHVIIQHARQAELLIIGARPGGTPLDGSTLDPVLREGPCPILICSSPDTAGRLSWTVRLPARPRDPASR